MFFSNLYNCSSSDEYLDEVDKNSEDILNSNDPTSKTVFMSSSHDTLV